MTNSPAPINVPQLDDLNQSIETLSAKKIELAKEIEMLQNNIDKIERAINNSDLVKSNRKLSNSISISIDSAYRLLLALAFLLLFGSTKPNLFLRAIRQPSRWIGMLAIMISCFFACIFGKAFNKILNEPCIKIQQTIYKNLACFRLKKEMETKKSMLNDLTKTIGILIYCVQSLIQKKPINAMLLCCFYQSAKESQANATNPPYVRKKK